MRSRSSREFVRAALGYIGESRGRFIERARERLGARFGVVGKAAHMALEGVRQALRALRGGGVELAELTLDERSGFPRAFAHALRERVRLRSEGGFEHADTLRQRLADAVAMRADGGDRIGGGGVEAFVDVVGLGGKAADDVLAARLQRADRLARALGERLVHAVACGRQRRFEAHALQREIFGQFADRIADARRDRVVVRLQKLRRRARAGRERAVDVPLALASAVLRPTA